MKTLYSFDHDLADNKAKFNQCMKLTLSKHTNCFRSFPFKPIKSVLVRSYILLKPLQKELLY